MLINNIFGNDDNEKESVDVYFEELIGIRLNNEVKKQIYYQVNSQTWNKIMIDVVYQVNSQVRFQITYNLKTQIKEQL